MEGTGIETPLTGRVRTTDGQRFTVSARAADGITSLADFRAWLMTLAQDQKFDVTPIRLADLDGWSFASGTGDLVHRSGRFFSISGLEVCARIGDQTRWHQPVICQPEVGILGILAREFDGVMHFLVQAKMEPGNINGLQVSPTVQATRSNYSRVHGGGSVPYLEYFLTPGRGRVLLDVLQSEQGAWFYRKRNRNMIVETAEDVPVRENFRWLTLGQLHELLWDNNVVNMDTRTVLSGIRFAAPGRATARENRGGRAVPRAAFRAALGRSLDQNQQAAHSLTEVLSWLNDMRTGRELRQRLVPLGGLDGWHQGEYRISRSDGRGFAVIAVDVRAENREVTCWAQPLIAPGATGLAAFLVGVINGIVHVLVHARTEAGTWDVAEIGPSVQLSAGELGPGELGPGEIGPGESSPAELLDRVLRDDPHAILYDAIHSEEGGRFWHAENRYVVAGLPASAVGEETECYRWLTIHQLCELVQYNNYLNVEARTLLACLQTLW